MNAKFIALPYLLIFLSSTCLVDTSAADHFDRYLIYWSQRTDVGSPGPRYGHALAYDSDRGVTVFFGGEYSVLGGNPEYFNDTWEYDGVSWKKIMIDGPVPDARARHAMCYDNTLHQVILFGGFGNGNFFNDVWNYESTGPQKGRWIYRVGVTGPSPRYAHTMVFDFFQAKAIVAGGTPESGHAQYADTWELNNATGEWSLRQETIGFNGGEALGAGITDHMMLYDSKRHQAVVVGGVGPFGIRLVANSDLYIISGENEGRLPCGSPVTQGAIVYDGFHDLYFQFGGNNYSSLDYKPENGVSSAEEIGFPYAPDYPCAYRPGDVDVTNDFQSHAPGVHPGNRSQCAMVYDEKRRVTVLFGGVGGTRYGDTWELLTQDRQEGWVDFNYHGRELGTFVLPFNTCAEGSVNVGSGGSLKIKAGSTSEKITFTNAMTIEAIGGPVIIGRP